MNWDDMRVFLAVARAEGLSAAAPVLKLDPATISRRILRLEERMGAALFTKSPQGYALTDLGQRLRIHASTAEEALNLATEEQSSLNAGLSGQIRIGAPDGAANFLLPQVCAALQAENPGLELQILALPRVVNLSKREADLAVTVSPPDTGRLLVQKVTDYRLHLAARSEMAAHIHDKPDLKGIPVVGYIPDMIFDKELDYLGDLGAGGVHLASNSVSVQMHMLRHSQAVGFVHDFALHCAPELRRVLMDHYSLCRSFYLVRHASDRHSQRLGQFAAAFSARLKAEVTRLEAELA
ncbi:LysR family transcriptional regulator [Aestuariibius sp. HNIBRBA575]|uniref:LysR family transcriptional regulator n=1 Tax=Aestuariibius sp. HNIBRBA575 TaxID=3233343 RepID=UPI0034A12C7D